MTHHDAVLDWLLRDVDLDGIPDEARAAYASLPLLGTPHPKVSAQGNPINMLAGVWPYGVAHRLGVLSEGHYASMREHLRWEHAWRATYYTGGEGRPYSAAGGQHGRVRALGLDSRTNYQEKRTAHDLAGEPMLNNAGAPIPLEAVESQHPHNIPYWIYAVTGWPEAYIKAHMQVQAVLSHPVCWDPDYKAINAREIGFCMRRVVEGIKAGITPDDCIAAITVMSNRLETGAVV